MVPLVPFGVPVVTGRFLRRYKRFFVDVLLEDGFDGAGCPSLPPGTQVVAHTANTGAMTGLLREGAPALLTWRGTATRKLPFELEALHVDGAWTCVNTGAANPFAVAVVTAGLVPELGPCASVRREVVPESHPGTRFDLCLERSDGRRCFVEVKSATLRDPEDPARVLFPDAVTTRGLKHLDVLSGVVRAGHGAAMLYVSQRAGTDRFAPAASVDPAYAAALRRAVEDGVQVFCVACRTDVHGLWFNGSLAVEP